MPGPVDYREALAQLLGVPSDSVVTDTLLGRLTPTISTERLFEQEQLQASELAAWGFADLLNAVNNPFVQLLNPAGSNTLIFVDRLELVPQGAALTAININLTTSVLGTLGQNGDFLDGRLPSAWQAIGEMRTDDAGGSVSGFNRYYVREDDHLLLEFNGRLVLPPGIGVFASGADGLTLNAWWRERPNT